MKRALLILAFAAFSASCGRPPKPVVFAQVDAERGKAEPSREGSPVLWEKAEGLRRRAEDAFKRGDSATAELLGQHALAAYHHAVVVARLGAANVRASLAKTKVEKAVESSIADEASLKEIDADIEHLQAEIAIRREALAPAASGKTDPARDAARWVATRANLAVADSLCTGAALLAPKAKGLDDAKKILAEVQSKAESGKGEAPIDSSTRARALCLKALTNARAVVVNGGGPAGDALLATLKDAGISASRDERGVVATLPQVPASSAPFEPGQAKLTAAGKAQLEALGKIAKANSTFAIVVVVHSAAGTANATRDAARAELAKQTIAGGGADLARIGTSTPGTTLPAVEPKGKDGAKNERVEVVFVGGP
ncbi:MAG: hypothetical protein ACXWP4_01285 [Polyangiales bacterium]